MFKTELFCSVLHRMAPHNPFTSIVIKVMNQILFTTNIIFLYNNKILLLVLKNIYSTKYPNKEVH